eukprot:TRINITY_DN16350_c0_g2_i1.p1 TRINITY_DN16350_c0_g2~~TRINITY_DN16350_c0_g2_i1.p1  ORF type:complete len:624 (+),score=73.43 TRINITY_DN16350_c0_g2_i1:198-2069(+)
MCNMVPLKINCGLLLVKAALCFLLCASSCSALMGPGARKLQGSFPAGESSWEKIEVHVSQQRLRTLLQSSPTMQDNGTSLILAAERTARKDPLENWRTYLGGWNIRDKHYWASVGSTATGAWIVALLWAFLGFVVVLGLCCCFCCRRSSSHNLGGRTGSGRATVLLFVPVIILTVLAIIGCGLLYNKTILWNRDMGRTLDVVEDEASKASMTLRNVSTELRTLSQSQIAGATLTTEQQDQLNQRVAEINQSANDLDFKAKDNSRKIRRALSYVRFSIIVVSALMLLLALLGLISLLLGFSNVVYTLVIVGWILLLCTWILVGVGLILDNATQDTCAAMKDWLLRPAGGTTMDDILPCADLQVANRALARSKEAVNSIVDYANKNAIKKFNEAAAGSGGFVQPLGTVCSPYGPSPAFVLTPCPAGQIDLNTAVTELGKYVNVSTALTQENYNLMRSAVDTVDRLVILSSALQNLTSCSNVRNAVVRISSEYCSPLHSSLKGQWVGLLLISVSCSILVLLWLYCVSQRGRGRTDLPTGAIVKGGPHGGAPPRSAPASVAPALPKGVASAPLAPRSPRKVVPPPPPRSPHKYMGDAPAYEQLPHPSRLPHPPPSAPKMPGYYEHNV